MPVKKKPQSMIPFDRNKHAALYYDGDAERFVCVLGYRPTECGDEYAYIEEFACDHPLEAIAHYEGTFAPGIRLRYGDWLESIGYHRYNGGKLARNDGYDSTSCSQPSPADQRVDKGKAHCPPVQR